MPDAAEVVTTANRGLWTLAALGYALPAGVAVDGRPARTPLQRYAAELLSALDLTGPGSTGGLAEP